MKPSTYCKNCGAYIPDGKKKCLACGFPVDVPSFDENINKVETTTFQECMPGWSSFKPIDGHTEQRRFSWNGYEINENGQVLSIPDDDEDEIPMTSFDNKMLNITFPDNYYAPVLKVANEVLQNIKQSKQQKQKPKPDIDLDDLMEKTFVTVKINDRVSRFYLGDRIQVCIADGRKFGCTFDGRVIGEGTKKKIDVCLVEA